MHCPELPDFDPDDPVAVENAFADSPILAFSQSWLPAPEPGFRPGTARIGWRAYRFLVLARLEDDHIFTTATRRNEPLFQLGDTLEIFVALADSPDYLEYHYAPNGTILQLHWPRNARELDVPAAGGLAAFAIEDNTSTHRVRPIPGGWEVLATISLRHLQKSPATLANHSLALNLGRYDHRDAATPPILSATAPLPACNFHARTHWHHLPCRQAPTGFA
jgi:hypothetical protein